MTPALIERLKELHAKATPGPWVVKGDCGVHGPDDEHGYQTMVIYDEGGHNRDDALCIATLHNALPDLLAELSSLRQSEAAMREALTDARAKLAVAAESEAGDHELLLAAEAVLRQFISAQNDFLASVMPGVIDDPLTDVQIRAQEWLQTFRGPAALGEPK